MTKHLRKLLNGLTDLGKIFLAVLSIIVGIIIAMTPLVLATEYHWAWSFGYVPFFLVWAYYLGDD